jgi:N-acetyl sugar amidotransferase
MRTCTRCVMDESDPEISFDSEGNCNHCSRAIPNYHSLLENLPGLERKLENELLQVKKRNKNSKYDGVIGLSGGVDSSYLLHLLSQKGLKPLVVHVDAGWNSIEAVENIYNLVDKLELDLETIIINWESMRELQLAYLQSGVVNQDVPQDHAFFASLYRTAVRMGLPDVFLGSNMSSESIMPQSWGQAAMDGKNLKDVYKSQHNRKLQNFPTCTLNWLNINVELGLRLRIHKPLNNVQYDKDSAKKLLIQEYGFKEYGNKHSESTFTSYYQKVYLPNRLGIDKRKAHLSALIVSGYLSREEAIKVLNSKPCSDVEERNLRRFVSSKLRVSEERLLVFEKTPIKDFRALKYSKFGMLITKIILKAKLIKRNSGR